ncbi:hypothetical protein HNQ80_003902 [Anaerosolibacter carboniphilus]|uniref:DUF3231 family protein n=1 Tax=Anaerosolibacter carboniphilus TaxID=1417629 RepID=A0A841L5T9_9FIRM|nr:DUF3231 family protein [Anaerosolibacter carboniphilus]MBB6217779.1 hypothetical protein [Anaerosolibacter carboniphilus]
MNLLEVAYDSFKPFINGEKKPLNVMEVSNLWFYLAICNNTLRNEELAYNTAQNSELKKILKDARDIHKSAAEEINKLLKSEGVPLPEDTPEKPDIVIKNIPEGAKLNDEEIANLMSFNLLLGINYASRNLTESIRPDVGYVFFKVIIKKVLLGITLKDLMQKHNWLRTPPPYKA